MLVRFCCTIGLVICLLVAGGCGGSGSGVYNGVTQPILATVQIVACDPQNPKYTEVLASQSISPLVSDTEVEFLHGQDGSKQVCVTTGAAEITQNQ